MVYHCIILHHYIIIYMHDNICIDVACICVYICVYVCIQCIYIYNILTFQPRNGIWCNDNKANTWQWVMMQHFVTYIISTMEFYPLLNKHKYGTSPCFMGKSQHKFAPFSIAIWSHQRVWGFYPASVSGSTKQGPASKPRRPGALVSCSMMSFQHLGLRE